jgi:uracil-DNA glycosylase
MDDGWKVLLDTDWAEHLTRQFDEQYWEKLQRFVQRERLEYDVYPSDHEVFSALQRTSYADTKVVILGQDPYHGPEQAHGLAFSVRRGVPIPPSLRNIQKELEQDAGVPIPAHGDLGEWADRGVLLLNTVLTVRRGSAGSHQRRGWEGFTDRIVTAVAEKPGVVFILWGRKAQRKATLIEPHGRTIITSSHPSPQSARRGFFGSRPFGQVDEALAKAGLDRINWTLS